MYVWDIWDDEGTRNMSSNLDQFDANGTIILSGWFGLDCFFVQQGEEMSIKNGIRKIVYNN